MLNTIRSSCSYGTFSVYGRVCVHFYLYVVLGMSQRGDLCYLWNFVFHTRKHLLTLYEAGTKASSLLRGELSHLEQRMGWIVPKTMVLENNNNNNTILHKM